MGFAKVSQFVREMSDGFIVEIQPCQSLVSDPSMGEAAQRSAASLVLEFLTQPNQRSDLDFGQALDDFVNYGVSLGKGLLPGQR